MTHDEMSAHIEIRQALVRYCRGVDRGIAELIESAYHSDAIDYHGPFTGSPKDFARLVVEKFDAAGITGQHHITNCFILLDGERAKVESYFLAYRPQRSALTTEPELVPLSGRYLDNFEKRKGEWRIVRREVTFDWVGEPIPESKFEIGHGYPQGARRENDRSYSYFKEN